MVRSRKFDETEARHAGPPTRHGRAEPSYDAIHDIRAGRPTELGASAADDEEMDAELIESEAARQERLAASPEAASEEAGVEAGPQSARREALGASPEVEADEADRLLERRPRAQADRPVGDKEE